MSNLTVIHRYWTALIFVFLFAFLLQGCAAMTPPSYDGSVTVIVGECPNGIMGTGKDDGVTGCPSVNYNGSATGFWHAENDKTILASDNKTCSASGSRKCQNSQMCWNSGQNKLDNCTTNYWEANGGSCLCTCGKL